MNERQIKETVVKAGIELMKSGLIVRTWGNISCRIDDTRFAVTPSGKPYETLRPEDIVVCNIANGKAAADSAGDTADTANTDTADRSENVKPSSEKGVHALVYRFNREAGFVIHTHQRFASAAASSNVSVIQDEKMGAIPVAAYGLPGTKKLVRNTEAVMAQANGAILMSHHGALCYGKEYGEAFSAAYALEEACERFMQNSYMKAAGVKDFDKKQMLDYYVRKVAGDRRSGASHFAKDDVFRAVYAARPDIKHIELADDENVVTVSLAQKPLPRLLDDFAQMMGRPMQIARDNTPESVVKALGKTNGVLIAGVGALCCAATESDARALRFVTEKNALTEICASMLGTPNPLSALDCFLMHLVYTKKYKNLGSKQGH